MAQLNNNYSGLILLSGLVGAGKTSLAINFAQQYHALPISFDVLKFYENSSLISQDIFEEFSHIYPDVKTHLFAEWRDCNNKDEDTLYEKYCTHFLNFLHAKAKTDNSVILLEGIQIFTRLRFIDIQPYPCIILTTPAVVCMRNLKRREQSLTTKRKPFELFRKFYIYHVRQRKMLNRLISIYQNLQSK